MIITKICSKCKLEKLVDLFNVCESSKDGFQGICKDCQKEYRNSHRKESKEYRDNHKKQRHQYDTERWKNNKEKEQERTKKWISENKEHKKEKDKEYQKLHKELRNLRLTKKRKEDTRYKFTTNIRNLIRISLKKRGYTKSSHTYEILGISYDELRNFLFENTKLRYPDFQKQDFLEKNKYHIDHIVPLSTAKNEEDVIRLCHYTNLQLLKAEDNLEKSDSLNWN